MRSASMVRSPGGNGISGSASACLRPTGRNLWRNSAVERWKAEQDLFDAQSGQG